jgi:hypothetical protein
MLHEKIQNDLKEALKAKDELRKETIKGILSGVTNELVAQKRKPQEVLEDEGVLSVIKRQIKQRKDSASQFEKGGRADLAAKELSELEILKTYLPPEISDGEIEKVIREKIKALSVSEKKDAGKLIGIVLKELKGGADGSRVKEIADTLLT